MSSLVAAVLVASLLPACGALPHTQRSSNSGGLDDEPLEPLSTNYALTNHFSITSASLAPKPAYELLSVLSESPGKTLVALASAAGVPAAETLFDALPNSLESRLGGWMGDAIDEQGISELRTLVEWSQLVLADVEVHSVLELELEAEAETLRRASHVLTNFAFHVGDRVIEESVPEVPGIPGAGRASVDVSTRMEGDATYLEMGEHQFGLLFGQAAYKAFESLVQSRYGTNVRGVLGGAIDCPAVASSVASKCVLGICVGHADLVEGLCNGALDSAAAQLEEQFAVLDAEVLVLERGVATVVFTKSGSELREGRWSARAQLGQGLRELPATFEGRSF